MKKRKVFFGRLKPLTEVMFLDSYRDVALLDCDTDREFIDNQIATCVFFRKYSGKWARFRYGANGFVYSVDFESVVVISEDWISEKSPEVEMELEGAT